MSSASVPYQYVLARRRDGAERQPRCNRFLITDGVEPWQRRRRPQWEYIEKAIFKDDRCLFEECFINPYQLCGTGTDLLDR